MSLLALHTLTMAHRACLDGRHPNLSPLNRKIFDSCMDRKDFLNWVSTMPNGTQYSAINWMIENLGETPHTDEITAVIREIVKEFHAPLPEEIPAAPIVAAPSPAETSAPKSRRWIISAVLGLFFICLITMLVLRTKAPSITPANASATALVTTLEAGRQQAGSGGGPLQLTPSDLAPDNLLTTPTAASCTHQLTYPGYATAKEQLYDWLWKSLGLTKEAADNEEDPFVQAYLRDVRGTGLEGQFKTNPNATLIISIVLCQ